MEMSAAARLETQKKTPLQKRQTLLEYLLPPRVEQERQLRQRERREEYEYVLVLVPHHERDQHHAHDRSLSHGQRNHFDHGQPCHLCHPLYGKSSPSDSRLSADEPQL